MCTAEDSGVNFVNVKSPDEDHLLQFASGLPCPAVKNTRKKLK